MSILKSFALGLLLLCSQLVSADPITYKITVTPHLDKEGTFVSLGQLQYDEEGALSINRLGKGTKVGDKFVLTGSMDEPTYATLSIGAPKSGTVNLKIFLEDGEYAISFANRILKITGGKYSQLFTESWKGSEVKERYKKAAALRSKMREGGLTKEQIKSITDERSALYKQNEKKKEAAFTAIATTHDDLYARVLALQQMSMSRTGYVERLAWVFDEITQLKTLLPNNKTIIQAERAFKTDQLRKEAYKITQADNFTALDFTAEDTKGEDQQFLQLMNKSELVLLDFWSTGCGPCIAEFPKLKRLYEKYRTQGFEIITLSADDEEEQEYWLEMVEEKELPWVNLRDKKGAIGEAHTKYGVQQWPTNFLFDTATGKSIGSDVHGAILEELVSSTLKKKQREKRNNEMSQRNK